MKRAAAVVVALSFAGLVVGQGAYDPYAGRVTDRAPHPRSYMLDMATWKKIDGAPAKGVRAYDRSFGTVVKRVTDAPAWHAIKTAYGTIQAWNADETLLLLYHAQGGGHELYEGDETRRGEAAGGRRR
jgi:hypothetical protein